MKWTYNWLLDYLDTTATAEQIADKLTEIGLEIEEMSAPPVPVVAKIIECEKIEGTKLHLLKVDDGNGTRQVMCGAPNCRVGLVGALARPGTVIEGNEIKVGKIRGYESNGMMCSPREAGISDDHEIIVELDETQLGKPLGAENDVIYEAKALANRPDYLAVQGIARDLAATGIGVFTRGVASPPPEGGVAAEGGRGGARKAVIQNLDRCGVYNFAEIKNVKIAPSSELIASRLTAIGITPRNAAIDATNYICYDLGQPMHCFDADEINGDIIIRNAIDGEEFTDLFDVEHILAADDLVITDAGGILALAGIIGGKRGMTTDATKNIILESAYFEPLGIRKTRRRLGLSTDSSYRFERGINPTATGAVLTRAIKIITEECGGEVEPFTIYTPNVHPHYIKYNPDFFLKRTGVDVSREIQHDILECLGYIVCLPKSGSYEGEWTIEQPFWRMDDAIPEKLVSDIIRIYGYDKIPMTGVSNVEMPRREKIPVYDDVKLFFAKNRNLIESCTFGFGNIVNEKLVSARANVELANPIADYMNTARNSLIPNMLDVVAMNEKRGYPNLGMFELGTVFDGPNPGEEHKQLVIARTGEAEPRHWLKRSLSPEALAKGGPRPVDVFDVKADLMAYFGDAETETDTPAAWAHPYRYGRLVDASGKTLAEFGELHPKLARHWKIKTPVIIGVIDKVAPNPHSTLHTPHSAGGLPPITRDFSFILEKEIPAGDIIRAAKGADARITNAMEFDFYESSIAFMILIEPDKNLSDADLLEIQNRVISAVEPLGAKIRDK